MTSPPQPSFCGAFYRPPPTSFCCSCPDSARQMAWLETFSRQKSNQLPSVGPLGPQTIACVLSLPWVECHLFPLSLSQSPVSGCGYPAAQPQTSPEKLHATTQYLPIQCSGQALSRTLFLRGPSYWYHHDSDFWSSVSIWPEG